MVNVLKALDEHLVADREEALAEAESAMERYVAARSRIAELEAAIDLRKAMGGRVKGTVQPIKLEAAG